MSFLLNKITNSRKKSVLVIVMTMSVHIFKPKLDTEDGKKTCIGQIFTG